MIQQKTQFTLCIALIVAATLTQLFPLPAYIGPVTGIALFSGVYIQRERLVFAIPIAALFCVDLLQWIITGTPLTLFSLFSYAAAAVIVLLGIKLRRYLQPFQVITTALTGTLVFLIVTNPATWIIDDRFPITLSGLWKSYVYLLPAVRPTVIGDLSYTGLLFGIYHLATGRDSS